ncbi:MAG: sugar phosphate isomerase/epimerase family protein [Terriglobia bacterium]
MKLGCSSQSYHSAFQQKRLDLFSWIDHCVDGLQLDGIEIEDKHFPSTSPAFLHALRKQIALRQLTLSSVTIVNNFGLPTAEEREAQVAYVRRWLAVAHELGSPVLRIFAGWPRPEAAEWLWDKMVDCLKQSCIYAEQAGVCLSLENHNHGGFVRVAEDALRILEQVGSEWLRLNLDTGNYLDGLRSIEKTASWAVHVHAKLHDVAADGTERRLDYRKILAILKRANYRGFLSLEYEGAQDAFEVLPRAVARFRQLLREV